MIAVTWNLAGRVQRLSDQAERVLSLNADVICLQELTRASAPTWQQLLRKAGYAGVQLAPLPAAGGRSRALAVLTAAREPLQPVSVAGVPWAERVLAARTGAGMEIVNMHSPISSKPDLAKVLTHEAVYAHLAVPSEHPRMLCGDFNTPRKEHLNGETWSFARDKYGRLRKERGERWEQAELALLRGLEPYGMHDAFRTAHGYARQELSWEWPRWDGGYRLDHMVLSTHFTIREIEYEHRWRKGGLSDHSALIARLSLQE